MTPTINVSITSNTHRHKHITYRDAADGGLDDDDDDDGAMCRVGSMQPMDGKVWTFRCWLINDIFLLYLRP